MWMLLLFFFQAAAVSPPEKRIYELMNEVQRVRSLENVKESDIQAIAERFCAICNDYHLGNPLVYAKWAPTQHAGLRENTDLGSEDAWKYLVHVLEQMSSSNLDTNSAAQI